MRVGGVRRRHREAPFPRRQELLLQIGIGLCQRARSRKPVVYQPTGVGTGSANSEFKIHNSEFVDGNYVLLADNRVGFEVGAYDPSQPRATLYFCGDFV